MAEDHPEGGALIRPCGDTALTVVLGNEISPKINDRVYALYHALLAEKPEGMIGLVPSFASLEVQYDPAEITFDHMRDLVLALAKDSAKGKTQRKKKIWKIPCCYSPRFAFDLDSVAEHAGLDREEVIKRHSQGLYRIYMLGFLPGFVYLGGLDPAIACPRLPSPRKKIPKGAVGIGGSQTGIYPLASPGGWRLIGSTPVRMYDPEKSDPVLQRPGDFIRFVPVDTCTYYDIAREVSLGTYLPDMEETD